MRKNTARSSYHQRLACGAGAAVTWSVVKPMLRYVLVLSLMKPQTLLTIGISVRGIVSGSRVLLFVSVPCLFSMDGDGVQGSRFKAKSEAERHGGGA